MDSARPLKEQRFFVGDDFFQVASLGVVDPGVTAQHLGLEAVPGLPCVEVCVVAQRLLRLLLRIWRQAHVAHGGLGQEARAEQTLEEDPVGPLLAEPLEHSHRLAGVHHGDLHLGHTRPQQGEQCRIRAVEVVHHSARHPGPQLRGVQPGQQEVPAIPLGTALEVVHLDQRFKLVAHVPLPPTLGGQDGEQAVHRVTGLVQGCRGGPGRELGPGNGVEEVALLQGFFRGGFQAQVAGVVVVRRPLLHEGRVDAVLELEKC